MEMNSEDQKPAYTGLPALLIGRAGRRLLRQRESLRRPGEEAGPGSSVPGESVARVSRRGRGFRPPAFASPSPPHVREPSPPPAPQPPRKEPSPGYLQLACITAPPVCHQSGCSRLRHSRRTELAAVAPAVGIAGVSVIAGSTVRCRGYVVAACAAGWGARSPRAHRAAMSGDVGACESSGKRGSSWRNYLLTSTRQEEKKNVFIFLIFVKIEYFGCQRNINCSASVIVVF